ncbi:DUF4327 family protein [Crocosphaera watsonii WH 8501]|uniref:DUF4327 domain-containing protein n=6 Tax=Crocosphaera watsonii TaxID=263511 RepID=Q4CAR0_CROWT|nr:MULTISPECIES: DUF4327 family protein [Crocosphaera]EAM52876.1 conserved hypothetical protein [Crocosphaera watsonii WH 8501]EHJ10692.1 hypothetical protein CWATWH0003_4585 [Crocosphaera watsonii WH 0003]MCH2245400.1 DUF4327 family protein [Crocosphaera sp.]NQZ63154.1 DUF4327 family protein [Crocosphaera sp.]CCQ49798.1 FIG00567711: hypothetical protein [Crocosphaera watsonii WH 8502]
MLKIIQSPTTYTIDVIKEEAAKLVRERILHQRQAIYTLCKYIPAREWPGVECELERHDFLLRDSIIDLLSKEEWRD